jgi:hypothetical protein
MKRACSPRLRGEDPDYFALSDRQGRSDERQVGIVNAEPVQKAGFVRDPLDYDRIAFVEDRADQPVAGLKAHRAVDAVAVDFADAHAVVLDAAQRNHPETQPGALVQDFENAFQLAVQILGAVQKLADQEQGIQFRFDH